MTTNRIDNRCPQCGNRILPADATKQDFFYEGRVHVSCPEFHEPTDDEAMTTTEVIADEQDRLAKLDRREAESSRLVSRLRLDHDIRIREATDGHASGLHAESPREFCKDCEAEGRRG